MKAFDKRDPNEAFSFYIRNVNWKHATTTQSSMEQDMKNKAMLLLNKVNDVDLLRISARTVQDDSLRKMIEERVEKITHPLSLSLLFKDVKEWYIYSDYKTQALIIAGGVIFTVHMVLIVFILLLH